MHVITQRNAHKMLPEVLRQLDVHGLQADSRNGPVVRFPDPATLCYTKPRERVLFWPERDANPFFHFFESLWMLAGRNDVAFPARFAGNLRRYSDDGKVFHGAYGHRWRAAFGFDQLGTIIEQLGKNKDDRRCYLQMWSAELDLGEEGKDFPCNVGASFQISPAGSLDMVVHNRSNDIIWGAVGANVVHFSMLQEYVACCIQRPVGRYWQVSSNMHAYVQVLDKVKSLVDKTDDGYRATTLDPYEARWVEPFTIMQTPAHIWQQDLEIFLKEGPIIGFRDPFFRQVATPLFMAHRAWGEQADPERFEKALEIASQCRATDWRLAAVEWLQRRREAAARAADDGVSHE